MSLMMIVFLVAGFALLLAGAEALVRGASRLAVAFGVAPLVVGLTIVSLGTSAPEISVSVDAALRGQGDLALGNVVGSNTFNILFALGIAAIVAPLIVARSLVRREVPIMIGAGVVMLLLSLDGTLGRLDGALLFAGLVGFLVFLIRSARREGAKPDLPEMSVEKGRGGRWIDAGLILAGLGLLVLGSNLLVDGAVELARALGVSELVIGLTVIAAGTGLPEVATSVVAALRGERDIAVGNAVGSNIFNILAVLGIAGVVAPGGIEVSAAARAVDIPIMVATLLIALPVFISGMRIARLEGVLFVSLYAAYVLYLVLDAKSHHVTPAYGSWMAFAVLPAVVIVVTGAMVHGIWASRRRRRDGSPTSPTATGEA